MSKLMGVEITPEEELMRNLATADDLMVRIGQAVGGASTHAALIALSEAMLLVLCASCESKDEVKHDLQLLYEAMPAHLDGTDLWERSRKLRKESKTYTGTRPFNPNQYGAA